VTHATDRTTWQEVTKAEPCPICKHDSWCRVSPDGAKVACRREANGSKRTKTYKDGSQAHIHILQYCGSAAGNGRPRRHRSIEPTAPGHQGVRGVRGRAFGNGKPREAADADTLDRAYRVLLDSLQLSDDHHDSLRKRGLSDDAIDAGQYRTLTDDTRPAALGVLNNLPGDMFDTIPGCLRRGGLVRINAQPGLLVPVRDLAGRIIALKIRPDDLGGGGKYRYVTSRTTKNPDGPSPGSPVHVPAGICGPCDVVRITEGELKADAAYRLSGVSTVSFPGVASWQTVLPILQTLGAKTVRLAFDADAATNKHVAKALLESFHELQVAGYAVELERWPIDAGKGIDDVLAGGRAANIEILTGPAVGDAVEQIAAAAGVHDDAGPLDSDGPNEAIDDPHRLARTYLERHGCRDNERILRNWRDEWQRWDGAAYRVVAGPEVRGEITKLVKAEFDAENQAAIENYIRLKAAGMIEADSDKGPPTCRKVTTAVVTNVAHALASECLLSGSIGQPTWLDVEGPFPAAEVLATATGLVHLPSLIAGQPSLLPPTPALFSGNALPYGFDPAAECPEWLRFLGTLWPDDRPSIDTLGEWFGYCLLPDTRQHKFLMLIGPPRSGKGTIARVLRGTIGEQNLVSPTLASLAGPFGLWPLVGKHVALVADARLSGRTDGIAVVERLLSISGEDPQDVARKNMPTLAGIPLPVRFVVMTNELPNMRDASGALTTRVILLRLVRSFRGREDRTLINRLLRELPGILNWAIRGWQRLHARGEFLQPESGQELLDDLQDLASPIKAFVDELCIVGPEYETPLPKLYDSWRTWCQLHGRDQPGVQETFAKDLRAAFPQISKSRPRIRTGLATDRRETVYRGIGLR